MTHFGIALPKWLVDHQNSLFVLLVYAGIFMIVLPVIVVCRKYSNQTSHKIFSFQCIWWQKSARYAGDQILTDTIQIYFYFLEKTPSIIVKRKLTEWF